MVVSGKQQRNSAIHIFIVLNWRNLLYNVVLFSSVLYGELVIYIHTSLPLGPPSHLPISHPSRSWQSTKVSSLCYTAASHYFAHGTVYLSMPISQFVPPSPSPVPALCPQFCSLYLHFYSCLQTGSSVPSF